MTAIRATLCTLCGTDAWATWPHHIDPDAHLTEALGPNGESLGTIAICGPCHRSLTDAPPPAIQP